MRPNSSINRRDFLRHTAQAAGVWAAMSRAAGAEPDEQEPWQPRFSASSIAFSRLPVEEACRRIAELGFAAVDIWSAHAGCPHLDDVASRLGADGLQRILTERRLALFAFSVYQGGYPRYAKLLGDVGGGVAIRGSAEPCEPADLSRKMAAFLESLRPELELAEEHNSYLAIENHGHALLDSLDSFKAFTDLNKSPRLGLALAPYHLQTRDALVEEAISLSGQQLFFFYAWQHGTEMAQLPGHGATDFAAWMAALRKVRYRGYVNPFMHGDVPPDEMARALAKSRDYLQACHDRNG